MLMAAGNKNDGSYRNDSSFEIKLSIKSSAKA
jgi:hypothetical protein